METKDKIQKLVKKNEKLQQIQSNIQYKLDTSVFTLPKLKEHREKKVQKLQNKIELNENKIKTLRFKNIPVPKKNLDSPEYYRYLILQAQNNIDDINSKVPSLSKKINDYRAFKIKYYTAKKAKYQHILEQVISKIELKDEKLKGILKKNDNKGKILGVPFTLKDVKPTREEHVKDDVPSSEKNDESNASENNKVIPDSKTISEEPIKEENVPPEEKKDGSKISENTKQSPEVLMEVEEKKVSTLGLTEEDIKNLNNLNLSNLDKLIAIHKEILGKLTKIEANMIDEQDTSIKTSSNKIDEIKKVSDTVKKPKNKFNLLSFLGLLIGNTAISFLKNISKFGIKTLKGLGLHIFNSMKGLYNILIGNHIDKLKKFFQPFVDKLSNIGTTIKNTVAKIIKKPVQLFNKVKNTIAKKVSSGVDFVKSKAINVKNTIAKKVSSGVDFVKSKAINVKNTIAKKVSSGVDFVKSKAINAKNFIKGKAVKVSKRVMNTISKGKSILKNSKLGKTIGKLSKYAGELGGKIVKFGKGAVRKISSKAGNAVLGKVLPYVSKIIGSKGLTALKAVMKVTPGVSILLGAGFAIKDALQGEYKRAAVDLLSGLIGSIPVVGPALGLAVSVGGNLLLDKTKNKNIDLQTKNKMKEENTTKGQFPTNLKSSSIIGKHSKKVKSSSNELKEKMKNAINIGEGSVSDIMFGVGKNKDLDIIYNYNPNQLYLYTEDEIIQKAQDFKDGKEALNGTEYIPKDTKHLNPNASKVQVKNNKDPKIMQKEQELDSIVEAAKEKHKYYVGSNSKQNKERVYSNPNKANFDNSVKLRDTYQGVPNT